MKSKLPQDYATFLGAMKARVAAAQVHAARAVNYDLVLLYWDVGAAILDKQETAGWGDAVVERFANDMRRAFPDMTGFSADNVWRMRQLVVESSTPEFIEEARQRFARLPFLEQLVPETQKRRAGKFLEQAVPESRKRSATKKSLSSQFLEQAVPETVIAVTREFLARVPWGHHVLLLKKIKDPAERLYYLQATAQLAWSRSVLLNQIKADAYRYAVKNKKTHNFDLALPEHFAEQANEILKSRYNLEFLGIGRALKERELEDRLIERVQQFILELGYGFCFVGRQYRLVLGRKEYFVDLLFYHRFLKRLVAVDLKLGEFEPEHAGKMDFYLNLLNDTERAPDDLPSIGIILCAETDEVEVEYALKSKSNPIGVAEYHTQARLPAEFKGHLPTAKQLAEVIRDELGETE